MQSQGQLSTQWSMLLNSLNLPSHGHQQQQCSNGNICRVNWK